MRELLTEVDQRVLLPKQSPSLFLVLFYDEPAKLSELHHVFEGLAHGAGFEHVCVCLGRAPALADRFALANLPAVAAIFDGTILCIDDDVSESSCKQLTRLALMQQQSLLEVAP